MEEYESGVTDEYLVFLLRHLIQTHKTELSQTKQINAVKMATKMELFKRLCVAKDMIQSSYRSCLDLRAVSKTACLSIPQLIRHFKSVWHLTPHRYLIKVRLQQAAGLLKKTALPVHEISWQCGFENTSAFCRAFKSTYGVPPDRFRKRGC